MELNIINDCTESQVNKVVKITRITVAAVRNEKYMFVKQRGKSTMELPGTQLVEGENTAKALRRVLEGMLGVTEHAAQFVCPYSVTDGKDVQYGILYRAEIIEMGPFPHSGLAGVYYLDTPPEDNDKWSFPETDKLLFEEAFRK